MSEHPETVCKDCDSLNVVWFAPSYLWNKVCRATDSQHPDPMLCPTCFIKRAESAGIDTIWRVAPVLSKMPSWLATSRWREEAASLRRTGKHPLADPHQNELAAKILEECAEEIEKLWRGAPDEPEPFEPSETCKTPFTVIAIRQGTPPEEGGNPS